MPVIVLEIVEYDRDLVSSSIFLALLKVAQAVGRASILTSDMVVVSNSILPVEMCWV